MSKPVSDREQVNFKATPEARRLLGILSAKLGVNRSAVFEMAVREFARQHAIPPEQSDANRPAA